MTKKSNKKFTYEIKDTRSANTSIQNASSSSISVVNEQTHGLKNQNSDSINTLPLMFPNKTYFESMLTFPDYKTKTPSINSYPGYENNLLYIVNGVRTTINPISTLNAGNIESISLIRSDAFSISTFKHDGTVIIITSKLRKK